MSKIATYSLADTPLQLSDRLIGTEAPRSTPSATPLATKNFSLGELLQLFSSEFPAPNIQAVLDKGNTAIQDLNLTGKITTTVIKPTNIEDVAGNQGEVFQILSKAVTGVNWIDLPSSNAVWGSITGTLTSQTDLISYLSSTYYPIPTGTTSQYVRGDGSLAPFPSGLNPTLQDVLNNGHDLVDDNNFQGTDAGFNNIGTQVIAIGGQAAYLNSGNIVVAIGQGAAGGNTGGNVVFIGTAAGEENIGVNSVGIGVNALAGNSGSNVNAIGPTAASANTGEAVSAIGQQSAASNAGNYVNAMGPQSAYGNGADNVNAFGYEAGKSNLFKNVNLFGFQATADGDNQSVFSKWVSTILGVTTKYLGRLSFNNITQNRKWELPDNDGTIALTSDIPSTTGIPHTTASGTDIYTATVTGVTSYVDGDAYLVRFTNGNTTSCTLNINSLGAIPLYRNNDGQLIGGDIWSGSEMLCVYNSSANTFQCIGTSPNSLYAYVTNADSVTLTKGMPVYAFGGTGDRMTVKRAFNTSDATSAQTVGLVASTSIAANQKGIIIIQGLLDGLSILPTSTWSDGSPVYLGATAGTITNVKPYAPNHLVYLGVVTTASNGSAGRMYVRVQNGYELDELHNVQAQSPSLKDTLWYDNTVSPAQWKTASIATILGYTPQSQLSGTGLVKSTAGTITYITDNSTDWDTAYTDRLKWDGGATGLVAATGRTSLGLGTFAVANYPVWSSGTPFVKMTAAGTFALDTSTYLTTAVTSVSALTLGTSGTDLSSSVANGTTTPVITLNVPTASASNRGALSSTDWTTFNNKQDKSMSAYSIRVNNTNASANATETTYKALGQQTYTGTITWTGTTAPSGTTNHSYNWVQIGNMVTLTVNLVYGSAGSALTQVSLTLPSDCPNPIKPAGMTSASERLYMAIGNLSSTSTSTATTANISYLRANAANNGFEIVGASTSSTWRYYSVTVTYFTS